MTEHIYPQYFQHSYGNLSYLFKFRSPNDLDLKVNNKQEKLYKAALDFSKLNQREITQIKEGKDLSFLLQALVEKELMPKEYYPISSKIDQIKKLIAKQDWEKAGSTVRDALSKENVPERMTLHELLETIYEASNPEMLQRFWIARAREYADISQLGDAEAISRKAHERFQSAETATTLAEILHQQEKAKESVEMYYFALEVAAQARDFLELRYCTDRIRELDAETQHLAPQQKMLFALQSQILDQQRQLNSIFDFLVLAPTQHQQQSMMQYVVQKAVEQNAVDLVRMLLLELRLMPVNTLLGHETPLILASRLNFIEMVEVLLSHPDVNSKCTQKSGHHLSSLALAEQANFETVKKLLIEHDQRREEDYAAFKEKGLGPIEYLHLHLYRSSGQECLVSLGIQEDGTRLLLDVSYPHKTPMQQYLNELATRGVKNVKWMTTNGNAVIAKNHEPFPEAEFHGMNNPHERDRASLYAATSETISKKFGERIGKAYKEFSEEIDLLIKDACDSPPTPSVVYRAIKLKSENLSC